MGAKWVHHTPDEALSAGYIVWPLLFIHEEAHTNVRFISCDGHQLYERGVDLEVQARSVVNQW